MQDFARRAALWVACLSLAGVSLAETSQLAQAINPSILPAPTQAAILTVTGKIAHRNKGNAAVFDAAMIDKLPTHEFKTWTPWFKDPVTFRGPLLQTVLDAVGAQGQTLQMVALNDYAVNVPESDARKFGPLLATHINGKVLGVRDKGPLFLIYPFDAKPETRADLYYGRSIWQLTRMSVH